MSIAQLRADRAIVYDKFKAIAEKKDFKAETDQPEYDRLEKELIELDASIERRKAAQTLAASGAKPVAGQPNAVPALVKSDPYEKDQSLVIGGVARLAHKSRNDPYRALEIAMEIYGERHPVTEAMGLIKALNTSVGSSGGFAVPPDFYDFIIPLLYARTTIRKAGAQTIPLPNGTLTVSQLTAGMSATWGLEGVQIPTSQQTFGQKSFVARKLTGMVPVTNDQMRYATSSFDARIRDDLVMQISLAEDIAGIRGDGTQAAPKGLKSFALSTEVITSNYNYTLATVNSELFGLKNKLESANIPMDKPGWLMAPRTKNYLESALNSYGQYIWKDEIIKGTLLGYPIYTTTQIPTNLTIASNPLCSEVYFADFSQFAIGEARQLEIAVSLDGTYTDGNGAIQSAFQNDMMLIRAVLSEDFNMWHNEGVAFLQGVAWTPAIQ
jgi:HK97 family phage major capsid protein